MALRCLQDDAIMTNNNSNCRHHQILSACGGFLFSRKSVARGALHPFFAKTPHFPLKSNKTATAAKPLLACTESKILGNGQHGTNIWWILDVTGKEKMSSLPCVAPCFHLNIRHHYGLPVPYCLHGKLTPPLPDLHSNLTAA